MTTPIDNLARWKVGSVQRIEPAANAHGPRPGRGVGFDEVLQDEDIYPVKPDQDGRMDLSNALHVFIGRTGPFVRLRPTQYRANADGSFWLDPDTGKPEVLRKDGERHISTTVLVDGKPVVREDYPRHLRDVRDSRPQWHIQPACQPLCDEAIGLSMVDECVPGIHSDMLLFFMAEETRVLPRLMRYGVAYVRRARPEYGASLCEAAVADALVSLFWPDARRRSARKSTRHAPPPARARAREFALSEPAYLALREFAIAMFVGYYNEALRIWSEVSNTDVRDKELMGGPKHREHEHRRRPVRGAMSMVPLATDTRRRPKRLPVFGT